MFPSPKSPPSPNARVHGRTFIRKKSPTEHTRDQLLASPARPIAASCLHSLGRITSAISSPASLTGCSSEPSRRSAAPNFSMPPRLRTPRSAAIPPSSSPLPREHPPPPPYDIFLAPKSLQNNSAIYASSLLLIAGIML